MGSMSGNKMDKPQATYRSYLLRLRQVNNAGRPTWRVSLESPGSRTQIHFDTLAALCAYLASQMGLVEATGSGVDDEGRNENVIQPRGR
jgi:hypothetical protein